MGSGDCQKLALAVFLQGTFFSWVSSLGSRLGCAAWDITTSEDHSANSDRGLVSAQQGWWLGGGRGLELS